MYNIIRYPTSLSKTRAVQNILSAENVSINCMYNTELLENAPRMYVL